jgi:hypothetical protein
MSSAHNYSSLPLIAPARLAFRKCLELGEGGVVAKPETGGGIPLLDWYVLENCQVLLGT